MNCTKDEPIVEKILEDMVKALRAAGADACVIMLHTKSNTIGSVSGDKTLCLGLAHRAIAQIDQRFDMEDQSSMLKEALSGLLKTVKPKPSTEADA